MPHVPRAEVCWQIPYLRDEQNDKYPTNSQGLAGGGGGGLGVASRGVDSAIKEILSLLNVLNTLLLKFTAPQF